MLEQLLAGWPLPPLLVILSFLWREGSDAIFFSLFALSCEFCSESLTPDIEGVGCERGAASLGCFSLGDG